MNAQQKEPRQLFPIDDHTGFIDGAGRVVIAPNQPELVKEIVQVSPNLRPEFKIGSQSIDLRMGEFSEGLAVIGWALCPRCRNPFWVNGIIDETGRLVIPPKSGVTRYGSFHEGLAQYSDQGWGFIDRQGHQVIPARFYEASDFSEGLASVRLSEKRKYGYINRKGELVIPCEFEWANQFHQGFAAVKSSQGKLGYIDTSGKLALGEKQWLEIHDFSEGLAAVKVEVTDNSVYQGYKEERYGFIDRTGKWVVPPRFQRVQQFSEGRALFVQAGKNRGYGFIDTNGQVVIAAEFADGKDFSEGLAAVAVKSPDDKKLWGYVSPQGQWVIRPQFQNAGSFNGGLAAVNCDEYGRDCAAYIDSQGKIIWQKN